MKRILAIFMAALLLFALSACGGNRQSAQNTQNGEETQGKTIDSSRVLIAYFSVPEAVDTSGTDAIAGASIVVKENNTLGNVEYTAETIQETVGGDLLRIETAQKYPLDHDPLVEQAAKEQDEEARPELATHIEDLDKYDTIILGYPIWWSDIPQPLYTFLEEYDFSGKTIIPFTVHGGSGLAGTPDTIAQLQPNATISSNILSISRDDVASSAGEIISWAKSLGIIER